MMKKIWDKKKELENKLEAYRRVNKKYEEEIAELKERIEQMNKVMLEEDRWDKFSSKCLHRLPCECGLTILCERDDNINAKCVKEDCSLWKRGNLCIERRRDEKN